MSPVKRRRRLPTLINRGLGLLEVILPRGASGGEEAVLPPGQRDGSGFWFPIGYSEPCQIFTAAQKELQANQRRIQKRRIASRANRAVPGGEGFNPSSAGPARSERPGAYGAIASLSAPVAVAGAADLAIAPEEVAVPLPKPLTDGLPVRSNGPPQAASSPRPAASPGPTYRPSLEGPLLPDSD